MAKAIDDRRRTVSGYDQAHGAPRDWRKSMSDNVAYALLAYTALQIFVSVAAMKEGTSSILPYLALVILVAAIIPACRAFENRWKFISDEEAHDPALSGQFRRDQLFLWVVAIGLPFLITGLAKAFFALV